MYVLYLNNQSGMRDRYNKLDYFQYFAYFLPECPKTAFFGSPRIEATLLRNV